MACIDSPLIIALHTTYATFELAIILMRDLRHAADQRHTPLPGLAHSGDPQHEILFALIVLQPRVGTTSAPSAEADVVSANSVQRNTY